MNTIAYNTSKGAVVNFTRALAAEWGEYGITVNALAPGFFPSKMTQGHAGGHAASTSWPPHAPLHRLGDDDDLKGAALLFASGGRQAHHRADPGGRRRRVVRDGRLIETRCMSSQRIPFPIRIPFVEELGLELHGFDDGKAELRVDLAPGAPQLVGRGARWRADDDARRGDGARRAQRPAQCDDPIRAGVVTIEMKTSFMRPAEGPLRAPAKLLHRSGDAGVLRSLGVRRSRPAVRPCHRHLQVPARAADQAAGVKAMPHHHQQGRMNMATASTNDSCSRRAPPARPTPQQLQARADAAARPLKDGEVLVRHHYLSLDPYMRGRMNDGKSYAQPQALDAVMIGGTVGEVVESRHAALHGGRQGGRLGRLAAILGGRCRPSAACCARSTRRACRCRPTSARWACRASPPGTG